VARPDATPYPRRWRVRAHPGVSTSPTALNTRRLGGVDAQGGSQSPLRASIADADSRRSGICSGSIAVTARSIASLYTTIRCPVIPA